MSGENHQTSTAELIRILEGTDNDDENGEESNQVGEEEKMVTDCLWKWNEKFSVVKFRELPSDATEDYVTVTNDWIQRDGNKREVLVTYPLGDSFWIVHMIQKRRKLSKHCKQYRAIIEHEADTYKAAERWRIAKMRSQPVRMLGRKLRSASKLRASQSKPDSSQDGRQSTLELKDQLVAVHTSMTPECSNNNKSGCGAAQGATAASGEKSSEQSNAQSKFVTVGLSNINSPSGHKPGKLPDMPDINIASDSLVENQPSETNGCSQSDISMTDLKSSVTVTTPLHDQQHLLDSEISFSGFQTGQLRFPFTVYNAVKLQAALEDHARYQTVASRNPSTLMKPATSLPTPFEKQHSPMMALKQTQHNPHEGISTNEAFDEQLRAITANQSSQPIAGPRSCQDPNVKNTIKPDGLSIISNVLLNDHKYIDLAAKSLNNMAVPTRNMHRLSISSSHHSPKVQLTSTTGRGKINQNTAATKRLDDQSTHTQTTNRMHLIDAKDRSPASKYSKEKIKYMEENTLPPYYGATSLREADSDPEIVLNHEQLTDETVKPDCTDISTFDNSSGRPMAQQPKIKKQIDVIASPVPQLLPRVPSSYKKMGIFLRIMKYMYNNLNKKMYETSKTAKGYVKFVEIFNIRAKSANAVSDNGTPGSNEQMHHRVELTQQMIDEFAENYTQMSTNIKRTDNNWNNLQCDELVIGDKLKIIMKTVETFNRSGDLESDSSVKKQILNDVAVLFKQMGTSWQRTIDMCMELNSNHREIDNLMRTYPRLKMSPDLRRAASPSNHVTPECTQVVENNHTVVTDRDNFSNGDQHMNSVNNVTSTKKRLNLPPVYDPHNSRWTLKYQEYMSGLVELVPGSGVFVRNDELDYYKRASSDCVSLAQNLLEGVFSESALSVCLSLFESDSDDDGCQVEPSLDERAYMTVLYYVKKHGENCHWDYDAQAIADGMRIKVQEYRRRCHNIASTRKRLILPPEYDPNNTRWTLKYPENMPGLVELTSRSRVFVKYDNLKRCEEASSNCVSLAQSLLKEVFSESALSVCLSYLENPQDSNDVGCQVEPSLDDNAYIDLLNYVREHGATRGWDRDHKAILDGMQSKVQEDRRCCHNRPQPTTEDCSSDAIPSCSRERR